MDKNFLPARDELLNDLQEDAAFMKRIGFSNIAETLTDAFNVINGNGCDAELEGGNVTYWHVCGTCHSNLDDTDRYCRQCGAKIRWERMTDDRPGTDNKKAEPAAEDGER